jgi:hypothetical protein
MTDTSTRVPDPTPAEEPAAPAADETFAWTQEPVADPGASATTVLESIREAVDDLAERAAPVVRDLSARAADLAAAAATKAAPLVKKAGEATAEASVKLAERSRTFAAGLRSADDDPAAEAAPTEETND